MITRLYLAFIEYVVLFCNYFTFCLCDNVVWHIFAITIRKSSCFVKFCKNNN